MPGSPFPYVDIASIQRCRTRRRARASSSAGSLPPVIVLDFPVEQQAGWPPWPIQALIAPSLATSKVGPVRGECGRSPGAGKWRCLNSGAAIGRPRFVLREHGSAPQDLVGIRGGVQSRKGQRLGLEGTIAEGRDGNRLLFRTAGQIRPANPAPAPKRRPFTSNSAPARRKPTCATSSNSSPPSRRRLNRSRCRAGSDGGYGVFERSGLQFA